MSQEKKHDLAWVVIQILVRGSAVMILAYIVAFIVTEVIFLKTGTDFRGLIFKLRPDASLTNAAKNTYQILNLVLFPISYLGIWWGCKYVVQKNHIDEKDYGKIGYWVGLIPVFFGIIGGNFVMAPVVYGIFLTPYLVKKWLKKASHK